MAIGGDLEPGTILRAYRQGLFPMHVDRRRLGWWSPVERGVIPLDTFRPSRSLRRSCRRYGVSVDRDFLGSSPTAPGPNAHTDGSLRRSSRPTLHELGWAHSVEAWTDQGELAGGLYGLRLGGLFAGESMVHLHPDGSKVALVGLSTCSARAAPPARRAVAHPHLASLGAVAVSREEYLVRLEDALGGTAGKPMG